MQYLLRNIPLISFRTHFSLIASLYCCCVQVLLLLGERDKGIVNFLVEATSSSDHEQAGVDEKGD